MAIFELQPASRPDGSFAAAWFDDATYLWNDERLASPSPLSHTWHVPRLKMLRYPAAEPTAVLVNPNALALSEGVKSELASFPELEFLPVQIESLGLFHVLHVTAAVELPSGSKSRTSPVSGNIVQIEAFPRSFVPEASFFRVLQPATSAARGRTTRGVYLSEKGACAIEACTRGYLIASELTPA